MKQIETSIIIKAAPSQIWNVFSDFKAYAHWNPFIKSIEGNLIEGEHLKTEIKIGSKKTQSFKPKVISCKKNQEFIWKGKFLMKGIFDGEHYFLIKKINDQESLFIQGEKFSGLLSKPILKMIKEDTIAGFEEMNLALKEQVVLKLKG